MDSSTNRVSVLSVGSWSGPASLGAIGVTATTLAAT